MKEKILAVLKTKYSGVQSLVLDRIAEHLATTVTEEANIETAISGVGGLIPVFSQILQSEGDRRATDAQKTAITNYEKQHNLKEGKPLVAPKVDDPNDISALVSKAVEAAVKPLQEELQVFKKKGSTEELTSKLKVKLAEKKIPEVFIKGRTIESEEQINTVLAEIEADFNTTKQHLVNDGVVVEKPVSSSSNPSNVDKTIEAWANKDKKPNS